MIGDVLLTTSPTRIALQPAFMSNSQARSADCGFSAASNPP